MLWLHLWKHLVTLLLQQQVSLSRQIISALSFRMCRSACRPCCLVINVYRTLDQDNTAPPPTKNKQKTLLLKLIHFHGHLSCVHITNLYKVDVAIYLRLSLSWLYRRHLVQLLCLFLRNLLFTFLKKGVLLC